MFCPKCNLPWGQVSVGLVALCPGCRINLALKRCPSCGAATSEDSLCMDCKLLEFFSMKIPLEMRTLSQAILQNPEIQNLLIAAVLNSEDDCVIIKESQLLEARYYKLIVTDVGDEGERAISLTAREK